MTDYDLDLALQLQVLRIKQSLLARPTVAVRPATRKVSRITEWQRELQRACVRRYREKKRLSRLSRAERLARHARVREELRQSKVLAFQGSSVRAKDLTRVLTVDGSPNSGREDRTHGRSCGGAA